MNGSSEHSASSASASSISAASAWNMRPHSHSDAYRDVLLTHDLQSSSHVSLLAPPPSSSAAKKSSSRRNAWGNLSYADLITQAINSTPEKRLTLSQVYEWMVQNIPYFKDKGDSNSSAGWKNSIRHNLSLHNRFIRVQNEGTGKSSWWMINPDAKHNGGKSTRRRASTALDSKGLSSTEAKKRGRKQKPFPGLIPPSRNNSNSTSTPSPGGPLPDVYGPESPNYPTYSYNGPTDLRTNRSSEFPSASASSANSYQYNPDWPPQDYGYYTGNIGRSGFGDEDMSPLRQPGFPFRPNSFSNNSETYSPIYEKPLPQESFSNIQVLSPSRPSMSPDQGGVSNHSFFSHIPTPESPTGQTGSTSSSSGSILERALASSVKVEQPPGSPSLRIPHHHHIHHHIHQPLHDWSTGPNSNMNEHFHEISIDEFIEPEYGMSRENEYHYGSGPVSGSLEPSTSVNERPQESGAHSTSSGYQPIAIGPPWVR